MLDSISEEELYEDCKLDTESLREIADESIEGKLISPIILFSK